MTRHPATAVDFEEFKVPEGWSDGKELVQKGDIPTCRTGHTLSKLKSLDDGSVMLVSTGGHSKSKIVEPFSHPSDSINILKLPEMKWMKLNSHDTFKRSFHSQSVRSDGTILIVGGKTMINGHWSRIHSLTEILMIKIEDDFSWSGTEVNTQSEFEELNFLTDFSYAAHEDKLYFFTGFRFPGYSRDNLQDFLPPKASRDKLPEFGRNMYQLELDENLVWSVNKCEGPDNCCSFN